MEKKKSAHTRLHNKFIHYFPITRAPLTPLLTATVAEIVSFFLACVYPYSILYSYILYIQYDNVCRMNIILYKKIIITKEKKGNIVKTCDAATDDGIERKISNLIRSHSLLYIYYYYTSCRNDDKDGL